MGLFGCMGKRRIVREEQEKIPLAQSSPPQPFKLDSFVYTRNINGNEIAYAEYGHANKGPAIVTFSGWNQDHRGWTDITPYLMERFRVISICFRGHGPNRDPVPDFGFEDHARDVLALLDIIGVEEFICVAASHGSWPAMIVSEIAGRERVRAILILSLSMSEASPHFLGFCKALQAPETWRAAMEAFFAGALNGSPNLAVREQVLMNMGGFGFDTWARSGRTIEEAYTRWGSPLKRMEHLADPPLIHHMFSQPHGDEYLALHRDFQQKHPEWFSYTYLVGDTHCPHMENPVAVTKVIVELIEKASIDSDVVLAKA